MDQAQDYCCELSEMAKVAKLQVEYEEYSHLEYTLFRIHGLARALGLNRVAFVAERLQKNLTSLEIDYLRDMTNIAQHELQQGCHELSKRYPSTFPKCALSLDKSSTHHTSCRQGTLGKPA